MISIFFGVGLLRPAPGTWASALAVVLGLLIYRAGHVPLLALATLIAAAAGFWACAHQLQGRPGEDPSEIVIDEVAGQWLTLCFPAAAFWGVGLPSTEFPWPAWVAAFILFRLFDIWKPWVIGRADRRGNARAVMIDDLLAGLFAGLGVMVLGALYHIVLFA